MDFKLTSSQLNFYTKNITLDSTLWNQSVLEEFPKVYTYEQLNDAYNRLVKANDSIRVKFRETDDGIVTYVEDFKYENYPLVKVESEEELMVKAREFLNSTMDFYGRLINCIIFQTPTTSGVMICAHHIVVDGFSGFVMSKQINKFLQDPDYIPSTEQYSEYVEKEEQHKKSKRFLRDKEFWKKQFNTNPVCDIFSTQNTKFDFSASELMCPFPSALYGKIKEFCAENDISTASFFNTIYATYINRKYDIDNFTIGVPVLNRTTQAELNTVGLYMHIVPLVVNLQTDSFLANAQRIQDSWMNIFRHQKFTQYDIREMLKEENKSFNNLFDVAADVLEFEPNDDYKIILPYSENLSIPLEIHLQCFNNEERNLVICYRTSIFTESDVQQILKSILQIMEYAVENPNKKINEFEVISDEEKQILLNDFNDTAHTYSIDEKSTLYSLFETASEENEEKVCIKAHGREITFKEFKKYAEKIDAKVQEYTKGEKSVIAVICERSFEMYGAIYGIIRGGNAYLPIDTNYPQERIDYILENSGAKVVIAQDKFCHLAGNTHCIDATAILNSNEEYEKIESKAEENDTAYVIYTSGSTGNPKGTKISHKSAINRILWMHDLYPLEENDVILQKTPYTFDVSVWELFWWGITGRTLCASKPDEHFLPAKILEETEKNKVTHLHFVPSVFDLFLTHLEEHKDECEKFSTVKYVFLSGEALNASLIERFYKLFDHNKVTLHNLYGPTECAVDVTYYDCSPVDCDPVPIGKPIYNTSIHIVDKHMKLVPIGVRGELCIGGVNVGQGYLNNPELTAEKFIDNPFGEGKLYKTGDLAYWREDGEIIFCGRMDNQVKLNGQRIELGEIENVIESSGYVSSAAVLVQKLGKRDVLVAFCCGTESRKEAIKELCVEKLPAYMVPQAFVFIDEMPLNPSGKLDRKYLSTLSFKTEADNIEPPQNETEKLICDAFSKALDTTEIGRNSDFFDLGGTSLSMASVLSEDIFKDVSAPEFIANATPEKLAKVLSSKKQQFCFVKPLYEPHNADKALILFPYAGGNAEAYASFVKEFSKKRTDFSLYFVNFLHTDDECVGATQEIIELAKKYKIYFYSHCAGSSLAMKLLNIIEESNPALVNHYIAGASIPLKKPLKNNIWNYIPDFLMKKILESSGANFKGLSKKMLSEIFADFRKDTDFMTEYFFRNNCKISCPISLIMSKTDPFTKDFIHAEALWSKYASNVNNSCFIESDSHYFQSSNSSELVDIIISIIS